MTRYNKHQHLVVHVQFGSPNLPGIQHTHSLEAILDSALPTVLFLLQTSPSRDEVLIIYLSYNHLTYLHGAQDWLLSFKS